jgi:hypothetical protein
MTSPYLRVFDCAWYLNLSDKAAHKLAPRSTRCIFLGYSANHKAYRCLDLTTNNIIVSRHVVFDEVDFPFSASPRLTNNLDIFLYDDFPGAVPIPAPLPAPHVLLGLPLLAAVGSPTMCSGGPTAAKMEAGGQIASPGGQTTPRTKAGGPTATLGGPTARTYTAPSSHASPTLATPCATPTTLVVPHTTPSTPPTACLAPTSTTTATPPTAQEPYPLH